MYPCILLTRLIQKTRLLYPFLCISMRGNRSLHWLSPLAIVLLCALRMHFKLSVGCPLTMCCNLSSLTRTLSNSTITAYAPKILDEIPLTARTAGFHSENKMFGAKWAWQYLVQPPPITTVDMN